jgi:hypothetical protein
MSSPNILPINSGPLIIRTYNDSSSNNTYLLKQYDYPVSTNYILTTSNNGLLVPTDNPTISSINFSSINGNTATVSSLTVSSILTTSSIIGSTLNINGPAVFRYSTVTITSGTNLTLTQPYWNKYIFINTGGNFVLTLPPSGPINGTFVNITQISNGVTTTVLNVYNGDRTLSNVPPISQNLYLMYNNIDPTRPWVSLSNN